MLHPSSAAHFFDSWVAADARYVGVPLWREHSNVARAEAVCVLRRLTDSERGAPGGAQAAKPDEAGYSGSYCKVVTAVHEKKDGRTGRQTRRSLDPPTARRRPHVHDAIGISHHLAELWQSKRASKLNPIRDH